MNEVMFFLNETSTIKPLPRAARYLSPASNTNNSLGAIHQHSIRFYNGIYKDTVRCHPRRHNAQLSVL